MAQQTGSTPYVQVAAPRNQTTSRARTQRASRARNQAPSHTRNQAAPHTGTYVEVAATTNYRAMMDLAGKDLAAKDLGGKDLAAVTNYQTRT